MQLIKYLAINNLKDIEIKRLEVTPIWPKESSSNEKNNGNVNPEAKIKRFTAKDLYAPLPQLREFGLPIIEWNGKWRKNTKEGKLDLKKKIFFFTFLFK